MAEIVKRRIVQATPLLPIAAICGGLGLALWIVGLVFSPTQSLYSYLSAYVYVTSLVLGALILLMIGHIMNARWIVVVRRLHEAIVAVLPVLALGFVPIALGVDDLYLWANPPQSMPEHLRHLLDLKQPYLNKGFFIGRTAFYFVVWIAVAELLRRWSLLRDRAAQRGADPDPAVSSRMRALSAAMLPLVGLCLTFAAFDWTMSLEPAWFSSIYGVYYFAGGFVGGVALVTVLGQGARRAGLLGEELSIYHFHALGRLLLAFVIFWAYIAFFQAMLIQIANKPEEVVFYLRRVEGSWIWIAYALIVGHFVVPFALLLPLSVKLRPRLLAGIALWILIIHYIDIYWLVMPVLHPGGAAPHWLDIVALLALAGLATAYGAWRQRGLSTLAEGDPHLAEALAYRSHV